MAETPKVHAPEIALAKFLETMVVDAYANDDRLVFTCVTCSEDVCEIEVGDTLRVLLNTALAHADCGE